MTNNYVVPFHHSEMLNTFGKIREPDDMDAIILMNRDEKTRNALLAPTEESIAIDM
ncbi:MAG: hypothetical protein WCL18_04860 [bacterium]